MFARVASFEGRDASLTDELIQRIRDQGPGTLADAKGFLGLFDRERRTALGITFFDSEEAVRNSERAFEDMAQHFPEEVRGHRTSVEVDEVMIIEGDLDLAKAARVTTFDGSPDLIDESSKRAVTDSLPKVRDIPGNVGAVAYANRRTGRTTVITLWQTTEMLRRSEEQADELRAESARESNQEISGVDRYEVAVAHHLSAVRA